MGQPVFSFNDIETFLTVYKTGSMSKAAEQLYISRQSVARSITALESLCKHTLFLRTAEGMSPTDFCHAFYKKAAALFSDVYELLDFSENYGKDSKPLSLALLGPYRMGEIVRASIDAFCHDHPSCKISISYRGWPDIMSAVGNSEVDCIYTAILPSLLTENLRYYELKQLRYALLVKKNQYQGASIHAEQLQDKQIVLYTRFNIQISMLKEYADMHGLEFKPPIATADLFLAEEYIHRPNHAVILEDYHADKLISQNSDYKKITLDPPLLRHSGLIFRKGFILRDEHKELIAYLQRELSGYE